MLVIVVTVIRDGSNWGRGVSMFMIVCAIFTFDMTAIIVIVMVIVSMIVVLMTVRHYASLFPNGYAADDGQHQEGNPAQEYWEAEVLRENVPQLIALIHQHCDNAERSADEYGEKLLNIVFARTMIVCVIVAMAMTQTRFMGMFNHVIHGNLPYFWRADSARGRSLQLF